MIKILKSTDKEVATFGKKEWAFVNVEHYGKNLDYQQKDFVFKAIDNGELVGSIKFSHEAGVLTINYLIVAHDKRGLGIGKALTIEAEEQGKKLGAHKLYLVTGKDWEAEKFYKTLGYKPAGVLKNHNFHEDFVSYEKFI
jgi:predicted N-acetyltransferase YhbS